jgi:hypothetical protein
MNMVSRASKLSLPLANESSRLSDLSANAPPALNTRKAPNYLVPRYDCGGGDAITSLANLRPSA